MPKGQRLNCPKERERTMKKPISQLITELEKKLDVLYQNEDENEDEIIETEEELKGLRWDFDAQIF